MKAFSASWSWTSPVRRRPKGPQTVSLTLLHSLKSNYLSSQDTQTRPRTQVPGPDLQALSEGPHAGDATSLSLPLLPFYFFPPVDPFFVKWFDTNRCRSGNICSEIPKDLCLYSDYTEKNWFLMFALHWSFLKPTFYSFFIYLHSLLVGRKVIYSNARLAKCFYTTVQNSQLFWVL